MKMSKKLLAMLLCLTMVLSLVPMVSAEEEAAPLAGADEVIVYYTNDVHTYIDNDLSYDNLAYLKQDTAQVAAGVLLVDAGDHVQGTAYGSMDKGQTIVELMEAAGYDLATFGNHEFDYGMARALEVASGTVPYVSCNFYHEVDGVAGETVLDAYQIFEVGGLKIAFVGITTPETFTKSTPAYFQDEDGNYIYGIAGGTDGAALYEAVQTAVDAAAAEGADYVIGLAHLGVDPASQPWTSTEVIANTTGLDAVIDGHSHTTVPMELVENADGEEVVLTQTGSYFDAIGRMVITAEGITTGLIEYAEETDAESGEVLATYLTLDGEYFTEVGVDATVETIKNDWMLSVDEQLGEVIGYAEVVFDNYDAEGNRLVRKQETNTGSFAADALYYLFQNMDLDVDVAIMNGGGVRNKAITGELTYKSCKEIHTFGNVACLQTITGQQLLDALEWGARDVGNAECGGFLHVSGVTYEIHSYIEPTVQKDDKGVWIGGPTGEYRVQNVQILQNGEYVALDLEAEYNLAGYNYTLRDLGDGFAMFDGAVNVLDYVMEDYMVLANYVQSFPVDETSGLPTITAENSPYGDVNGNGRIVVVAEDPNPAEPTDPVEPSDPTEPEPVVNPFTDVAETDYFYESVLWAVENGVTAGTSETTFGPELGCTRGQIVTMLWAAAGKPEPTTTENPFTDVAETDYFYKAVLWAVENGITSGVAADKFAPAKVCTRAEAVTFLWKNAGAPEAETKVAFTDVADTDYFCKAVAWAVEKGVTAGTSETTFGSAGTCVRAHIVTFLYKAQ